MIDHFCGVSIRGSPTRHHAFQFSGRMTWMIWATTILGSLHINVYWLVVWNMNFIFPFSWECHNPNWWSQPTTNQSISVSRDEVYPRKFKKKTLSGMHVIIIWVTHLVDVEDPKWFDEHIWGAKILWLLMLIHLGAHPLVMTFTVRHGSHGPFIDTS